MLCPDCNNLMIVIEFKGVEADWCPQCEGYWLDKGELVLILESEGRSSKFLESLQKSELSDGNRKCPVCLRQMQLGEIPLKNSKVEVDLCQEHGIWFDKGELQSVIEFASQLTQKV